MAPSIRFIPITPIGSLSSSPKTTEPRPGFECPILRAEIER